MGKKKKFIDKKKSATFHLLARDTAACPASSSADGEPTTDRVFVRVDNNPFPCPGFLGDDDGDYGRGRCDPDDDPNSAFADAPGDTDEEEVFVSGPWASARATRSEKEGLLPDHVRKEILELGLPDDGYNYLLHLREIKNAGGGSAYFHNPKAKLDRLQHDVKVYDASRLRIDSEVRDDTDRDMVYAVALNTRPVKAQKAVDPDVLRLLDDSDLSRFGSDVEDLEEDFVVKANLPEGDEEKVDEVEQEGEEVVYGRDDKAGRAEVVGVVKDGLLQQQEQEDAAAELEQHGKHVLRSDEKPRVRRLLDEQFDLLTLREYDNDSDSDDVPYIDTERELLNSKLHDALKEFALDDLELQGKYGVPGSTKHGHQEEANGTELEESAEVIRKCAEYAERYLNESEYDEMVFVEESSDESEAWDCETIVSTYSNLDNHPGRIQAPENPKRSLPRIFPGDSTAKNNVIALRGNEKLPVDYLPNKRRTAEKVKTSVVLSSEKPKRRPHSQESKEEKKERKSAIKEERREARKAKKELRGLYKFEAQRAQKVTAEVASEIGEARSCNLTWRNSRSTHRRYVCQDMTSQLTPFDRSLCEMPDG
ncbi:hypothetical protein MUK42_03557 [Musa troglodytarum]|uniref:Low temperature viability protein n=1 Tax=Musa troglodytarum TaxID=320322 RepID=A0A9E7EWY8_9LILI|nr:hypothetical protein MUK42_03557 [Musa troglodytarum]